MTAQFKIPIRYIEKSAREAFKAADPRLRAFVAKWSGASGAILLGPTKLGKSLAAAAAATRVLANHPDSDTWVRWVRADELTLLLSSRGGYDDIEALKRSRVLVLDELGYEPWPDQVLTVIGARHDWNRPTLVTSGLRLDSVTQRYGDATLRRIVEVGQGTVVDCWAPQSASRRAS